MKSGIGPHGLGLEAAFAFKGTSPPASCSRGVLCLILLLLAGVGAPLGFERYSKSTCYFCPMNAGSEDGCSSGIGPAGCARVEGEISIFCYMNAQDKYSNGSLVGCAGRNPPRKGTELSDCHLVWSKKVVIFL